jgi:DNA mismatch endonuclease (patch repair protein)
MDKLTKDERSERMRRVRSKGNRSTEWRFRSALMRKRISGWTLHDSSLIGSPDFVFRERNLAVFIDGCFWHGCRKCKRPVPQSNREYWTKKIRSNIQRARKIKKELKRQNFVVARIWEHELRSLESLDQLVTRLLDVT